MLRLIFIRVQEGVEEDEIIFKTSRRAGKEVAMPNQDRTGPQGQGSRTGRRLGLCSGNQEQSAPLGRGMGGQGLGRGGAGRGRGRGRGMGRGFGQRTAE